MDDERRLIERLRKVEALFAEPGTAGERPAAEEAPRRIRERRRAVTESQHPEEFRFSLGDMWSRSLFIALPRRHGLDPYRHRGQRHTTVVVTAPCRFVDETLRPEFQQLHDVLVAHLGSVTKRVIAEAHSVQDQDVDERDERLPSKT